MDTDNNYSQLQNPGSAYAGAGSPPAPAAAKQPPPKTQSLPEVVFVFYVLSSALTKTTKTFIENSMAMVQYIWKPRQEADNYDEVKKFAVTAKWDGSFKTIDDKNDFYKLIEYPLNKPSDKTLSLIKDNFSNPNFDAIVPVFICYAAWDELNEPGTPREGLLRGFTVVRSLPWFTGERAILLFSSQAGPKTLAHELSHWCGFTHAQFKDDPDNIGYIGGGGFGIDREQLRKYYKWATELSFRKTIGTK